MKYFFSLFFCLASYQSIGQTVIPDAAFEQYLISIGADSGMPDGSVPTAQIAGITELQMASLGITDLTGIEDFAALSILNCAFNTIVTLDVSQNTNLQFLFCSYNQLTSLNVSGCTGLFSLDCEKNNLTSLDVTMNPTLAYLNCGQNDLNVLDISNNDLTLLACYANNLTSLNLTDHPNLEVLQCEENQLTVLDLATNTQLEFLNAGTNQITALDISGNPLVNECMAYNNPLECLNVRNGNNINFLLFDAHYNPSLACIEVDDAAWSTANWSDSVDTGVDFSVLCENACSSNFVNLDKNQQGVTFELYPNPSAGLVHVRFDGDLTEDCLLHIFDLDGRAVFYQVVASGHEEVQLNLPASAITPGIYLVKYTGTGFSETQRLVIQ